MSGRSSSSFCPVTNIGATPRLALLRFKEIGEQLAEPTDPRPAGNGSLMRLAPVPAAGEMSRTTHGAINLEDDADTTGAIYEQLAGTLMESGRFLQCSGNDWLGATVSKGWTRRHVVRCPRGRSAARGLREREATGQRGRVRPIIRSDPPGFPTAHRGRRMAR